MPHIRSVIASVAEHDSAEVLGSYGIAVVAGEARFTAPNAVEVDGRTLTGRRFVIATGSRPRIPRIPGLDPKTALTSDNLWDIDALPRSLAILGGGRVAAEMASAFTRLGTRVTLLVRSKLLRAEDPELVERLAAVLAAQGVEILTGASVQGVESHDGGLVVTAGGRKLAVERLLTCAGRAPVMPAGLDVAGVDFGPKGIMADAHMRTSARHIFAAGDVTGPYRFTHTAERAGIVAATNALLPIGQKADWRDVVWVLFTEPELAHLGMTEEQARTAHGNDVHVRRYEFAGQDRARAESATSGLAKFVLDHRGRILGAHILGERAGELIQEAAILMHEGKAFSSLSSVMHAYPTFADAVKRPADAEYAARLRNNPVVREAMRVLVGPDTLEAEP